VSETLMENDSLPLVKAPFYLSEKRVSEYKRSDKDVILLKLSNIKHAISDFAMANAHSTNGHI
jgi:hypothetical protein